MTNPDYTHYVLIVDRSGSMVSIRDDTEGGIRHFVKEQAGLPGKKTLSLYQFDTDHDEVCDFSPLSDAESYVLSPRGSTALLDACGFAITKVGEKLAAMPEDARPGKVIVTIATDGQENSSREYNRTRVKALIEQQRSEYKWEFTYIGANQDSFAEAGAIGIPRRATMDYLPRNTRTGWNIASSNAAKFAGGQSASIAYSDAERAEAVRPAEGKTDNEAK